MSSVSTKILGACSVPSTSMQKRKILLLNVPRFAVICSNPRGCLQAIQLLTLFRLNLQELSDSQQDDYAWGQSPVPARLRTRFSSECEQADCQQPDSQSLSDDLLASGHSSTSYADLCCGESDIFQDRQTSQPRTHQPRQGWEPAEAMLLQRTKSEPPPHSPCASVREDEVVLKEMIRYCRQSSH